MKPRDTILDAALHADGSPRVWDEDVPATLARIRATCAAAGHAADPWDVAALAGARRLLGEADPPTEGAWALSRYADSGLVVATQRVRDRTLRVWARFGARHALDLRVELDGTALLEGGVTAPSAPPRWSLKRWFGRTGARLAGARAQGRKVRIEGVWGTARRIVRIEGTRVVIVDTRAPSWAPTPSVPGVEVRLPAEPPEGPATRWRTVLEWRPAR